MPVNEEKFYKLPMIDRIDYVNSKVDTKIQINDLITGGLKLNTADSMTENVIGMISLPLSVVP